MLVAPMKNSMPVWASDAAQAQRVRNYVANGNHMIFTGGSLVSLEFINRLFPRHCHPPGHRRCCLVHPMGEPLARVEIPPLSQACLH